MRSTARAHPARPAAAEPMIPTASDCIAEGSRPPPIRRAPWRWPPTTRPRAAISASAFPRSTPRRPLARGRERRRARGACARPLGQRHPRGAHRRRQAPDPGPHPRGRAARLGRVPRLGPRLRRLGDRRPRLQGRRAPAGRRSRPARPGRRLDGDPNMWVRRTALVAHSLVEAHPPERRRTRPSASASSAGPRLVPFDRDRFIQKAIGRRDRSLSSTTWPAPVPSSTAPAATSALRPPRSVLPPVSRLRLLATYAKPSGRGTIA